MKRLLTVLFILLMVTVSNASDQFFGGAKIGATSVSVPILLRSTTDNTEVTGKVYTDVVASYWRQGGTRTSITTATLAAVDSAYSSGGFKEVDSTNMPGIYRFDIPNAALSSGADWVVVTVKVSGTYAVNQVYELVSGTVPAVTLAASQPNYAPAIAGDAMTLTTGERASTGTAVWATTTRALTDKAGFTASTVTDKTGYTATCSSVTDKTGYSLTQGFPSNFSALAITAGGAVTSGTVSDKTGYTSTCSSVTDKTGYSLSQTFPTNFSALAITAGGATTVGTNNDKTGYTAATVSDKTGYTATCSTVSDKTGYSLSQGFPTNFSSMAITAGGAVTVGTNNDKTGYTASTVSDKTGYSLAGSVTCGTVSDKTGYSLSQTFPTNFSSLAINGSGYVTSTNAGSGASAQEVWEYTTRTLTSAGSGGATAQEVWEYGTRALTDKTGFTASTVSDKTGYTATCSTVSDKTGYSLSQSFPTNFSSLAIDGTGKVTVGTNSDKTGYTASTVSDKTGYSLSGSVTCGTVSDKTGYSLSGPVTCGTVSDKTGYTLSTTFPTNFSSLLIDGTGKVHTNTSDVCTTVTNPVRTHGGQ